ncbi:MAG: c-type cytochrome [Gammaproteobacteria bacterium]
MKKLMFAAICAAVSMSASAARGDAANGEALVKKYNCAACHGDKFNNPIDPSYPKLAGQHAEYLAHALVAYKRGDGPNGRVNAIMAGQVKPLSNKDIIDIATYLNELPPALVIKR